MLQCFLPHFPPFPSDQRVAELAATHGESGCWGTAGGGPIGITLGGFGWITWPAALRETGGGKSPKTSPNDSTRETCHNKTDGFVAVSGPVPHAPEAAPGAQEAALGTLGTGLGNGRLARLGDGDQMPRCAATFLGTGGGAFSGTGGGGLATGGGAFLGTVAFLTTGGGAFLGTGAFSATGTGGLALAFKKRGLCRRHLLVDLVAH